MNKYFTIVIAILLFTDCVDCLGLEKYKSFQIVRVNPRNAEHRRIIKRSTAESSGQAEVLHESSGGSDVMDVLVSPGMLRELVKMCKDLDIPLDVVIPDLPRAIMRQLRANEKNTNPHDFDQEKYNTLPQINNWLEKMEKQHPDVMKLFSIGKSFEERPLNVVQLSHGKRKGKPAIWMDAAIHANEWIGPTTLLYFIAQFLKNDDDDLNDILDNFVLYMMPVFNVDGYHYTWTEDRLWRKSRSIHQGTECVGVDMNRNWDFAWNDNLIDSDACSRTYHGPFAFSEPENVAVAQFLRQHNNSIKAYLAYHSFSQYWMTPYSYTAKEKPPNYDQLMDIGNAARKAIKAVHGTRYQVGTVANLIGETFGSSVDYVYNTLNIKYSFGIELRDSGAYGTLLPPDQIIPNGQESLAAFKVVAKYLIDNQNIETLEHLNNSVK